jgi:hypothetical protein
MGIVGTTLAYMHGAQSSSSRKHREVKFPNYF